MNKHSSRPGITRLLIALLIFIFAPCAHALTIHIVPERIEDRAVINLTRPFYVLLHNEESQDVRIWNEKSTLSYGNLMFELKSSADGNVYQIGKPAHFETMTLTTYSIIPPGEFAIRVVNLSSSEWTGVPIQKIVPGSKWELTANFEIDKSSGQEVGVKGIWVGKSSTTAKVELTNKREVITSIG